jgi:predicted Zn finger-like uncharacterized protein
MYTRCPTCSTCFRVTDRHLAIAKGKVRCGQCQLVFNAPDNAIDDLPVNSLNPQVDKKPAPSDTPIAETKIKKTATATPIKAKEKTEKIAKPVETKKPKKTLIAPPLFDADATMIADTATLDKEDDVFDNNFDLDAAIDELTQAAEDEVVKYDITATSEESTTAEQPTPAEKESDDVFKTDAYDASNASSVTDILNEMEGQLSLNIDESTNNDFEFIELDAETDSLSQETEIQGETNDETLAKHFDIKETDIDNLENDEPESENIKENAIDEDELFDQIDLSDFQDSDVEEDIILEDFPSVNIGQHAPDDENDIPLQLLRNDIERLQASPQRRLHPLLSLSFIIILLAISFSQLTFFRAHDLANLIPSTRPLLETFCQTVGCHYSGPHDTKQIQLLSRDVRLHPKEKKALLISAAMINNAPFAQPYPDIHIRLSDISGNIVAERVFNAKTYMGKLSNPFLLMKSKTPVHINFEVVDPGKDAVNFEFTFL